MGISWLFSKHVLLNRTMLWTLLWVNGLGTLYGFQWYSWQIGYTIQELSPWLVLFVPDSPTASLFFTLAIAYLLWGKKQSGLIRGLVEALAVITSIKYGIWAVVMIIAGNFQGDPFQWQHGMLIISHLGMAVEAMLYARFFSFKRVHLLAVFIWTLSNDLIDYSLDVFPSLPRVLHPYLPSIQWFTMGLSVICSAFAWLSLKFRKV